MGVSEPALSRPNNSTKTEHHWDNSQEDLFVIDSQKSQLTNLLLILPASYGNAIY